VPPDRPAGDGSAGIQSRIPPGTAVFITIAVFVAAVQELRPEWVGLAERDPERFAAGEWWRVVTALFAYDDGPVQKLGIVFTVLALGLIAERKIGSVEWLIIAFVSGLAGQIVGLWWQPYGAGSSVAVAGLLGATAAWLAWPRTPLPWFARIGSLAVLALAIYLLAVRDLNGPPIFVGAGLTALFLARSG
jgi:rhomboid protease GluP